MSAHREQMEKAYVDGFMEFLLPITNTPNGACMSPKKVLTLMAAVRLQMGPNIADVEGQPIPLTFRQTGNHLLWGPLKATLDGAVFDKKQNVVGCSIGVSNMADGFSVSNDMGAAVFGRWTSVTYQHKPQLLAAGNTRMVGGATAIFTLMD